MSQPPGRSFGKRQPPLKPAPKRSQGVRLKVMAGAGAAALGLYAVMPHRSCDDRHYYETLDTCLAGGVLSADDCRTAFAAEPGAGSSRAGVMSDGRGLALPVSRQADGRMLTSDGRGLNDALACGRRGSSSHTSGSSHSGSSSGSRRSWWGSSSSSSSSSSYSAVSSPDSGHAVSRGGFGSSGHGFFGGS